VVGGTVDIGPFEFAANVDHLVEVVVNWGGCEDGPCAGDFNCDGEVGVFDLIFVLTHWG
jgi:hypothetical protein